MATDICPVFINLLSNVIKFVRPKKAERDGSQVWREGKVNEGVTSCFTLLREEEKNLKFEEIMKNKIGEIAGKIWEILGKKEDVEILRLPQILKEKGEIVYQALGWLEKTK